MPCYLRLWIYRLPKDILVLIIPLLRVDANDGLSGVEMEFSIDTGHITTEATEATEGSNEAGIQHTQHSAPVAAAPAPAQGMHQLHLLASHLLVTDGSLTKPDSSIT